MRRTALLVIATFIIGIPAVAANQHQTQQTELRKAGTVPGSPMYIVDKIGEGINLALTFSKKAKAKKKMRIAEERLAEARKLSENGKDDLAQKTEKRYAKNVKDARNLGQSIAEAARQQEIEEVISRTADNHMTVLAEKNVVPGDVGYQAKKAAEDATVATENDPVEKAKKQARVAGHRVNESRILAEQNRTQEATDVAKEYDDEMAKLSNMSEEIADAATRRQVNEVVARATQRHMEALNRVYEKVPAQAQDAIKNAMQRSMMGHQRAVQNLKQSQGGIPSGVQEQIPDRNVPAGVERPRATGTGPGADMNKSEAIAEARKKIEAGRKKLQTAVDQLDRNETELAEATYGDAVEHFDTAIRLLQDRTGSTVQTLLQQARDGKSTAQQAQNRIQNYNQQQSESQDGGNQTDSGTGTNSTSMR